MSDSKPSSAVESSALKIGSLLGRGVILGVSVRITDALLNQAAHGARSLWALVYGDAKSCASLAPKPKKRRKKIGASSTPNAPA